MDYAGRDHQTGGAYAVVRHAARGTGAGARRVSRGVAMSHAAPPDERRRAQEERLLRAWQSPMGWRYWSDVNNSRVGVWYTAATFGFLIFGGVLALLMRMQLAT